MSNELATTQENPTDIFGGMYCSITAETQEQRLEIFDAVSNSQPLDDLVGKTVTIENVIIQPTEMTDNTTGEVAIRNRIVVVSPTGEAYGCCSSGVETSMKNLFAIVGCPPWNPPITFDVVKKQGRNGYKFTTLQRHKPTK